jgi:hypothetical protein
LSFFVVVDFLVRDVDRGVLVLVLVVIVVCPRLRRRRRPAAPVRPPAATATDA